MKLHLRRDTSIIVKAYIIVFIGWNCNDAWTVIDIKIGLYLKKTNHFASTLEIISY